MAINWDKVRGNISGQGTEKPSGGIDWEKIRERIGSKQEPQQAQEQKTKINWERALENVPGPAATATAQSTKPIIEAPKRLEFEVGAGLSMKETAKAEKVAKTKPSKLTDLTTDLESAGGRKAGAFVSAFPQVGASFIGAIEPATNYLKSIGISSPDDFVKSAADRLEATAERYMPEDPTFLDNLASGAGSAAAFFIPSMITGGGNILATGLEAMSEAGSVYRENKANGLSDQQANESSIKTFVANAILIGMTNKFGAFDDKIKNNLLRAIVSGPMEGIQEAAQSIISNWQTGREDIFDGVVESGIIGTILGLPMGYIGGAPTSITKNDIEKLMGGYVDPTNSVGQLSMPEDQSDSDFAASAMAAKKSAFDIYAAANKESILEESDQDGFLFNFDTLKTGNGKWVNQIEINTNGANFVSPFTSSQEFNSKEAAINEGLAKTSGWLFSLDQQIGDTAAGQLLKVSDAIDKIKTSISSLSQEIKTEKQEKKKPAKLAEISPISFTTDFDISDTKSEKYRKAQYESEIFSEFSESRRGERTPITDEQGSIIGWQGIKSTFPAWIPDDLRSRKLVDSVVELVNSNKLPEAKKKKTVRLYEALREAMASYPEQEAAVEREFSSIDLNNIDLLNGIDKAIEDTKKQYDEARKEVNRAVNEAESAREPKKEGVKRAEEKELSVGKEIGSIKKTLYNGRNGKVIDVDKEFANVLSFDNSQEQALKELAAAGNERAASILADKTNFWDRSDKLMVELFGDKYDAIEYQNKDRKMIGKEYHELKTDKHWAENRDTAVAYSLKRLGAKEISYPNKFPEKGVKIYGYIKGDVAKIGSIEITASKRKSGLGKKYVSEFEQWALDNGAKKIEIDAYKGSVGFWDKMGYTLENDFPVINGVKQDYKYGYKMLLSEKQDISTKPLSEYAKELKSSIVDFLPPADPSVITPSLMDDTWSIISESKDRILESFIENNKISEEASKLEKDNNKKLIGEAREKLSKVAVNRFQEFVDGIKSRIKNELNIDEDTMVDVLEKIESRLGEQFYDTSLLDITKNVIQSYEKPSIIRGRTERGGLSEVEKGPRKRSEMAKVSGEVVGEQISRGEYYKRDTDVRIGLGNQLEINKNAEALIDERGVNGDYSDQEKYILSLYSGMGGKETAGAEGRGLLDEYYTPVDIASSVWDLVLKETGDKPLMTLEPSIGTGVFANTAPKNADIYGKEINKYSAAISKILNDNVVKVEVEPFENIFISETGKKSENVFSQYDVVIGNPPYGQHRGRYKGLGEEPKISRYEDYFIKRGMDLLNDGGILAMVVPSGFLRGAGNYAKQEISRSGYLYNAIRLPNGVFESTDIGTDIVLFKKEITADEETINSRVKQLSGDSYFAENQSKIAGEATKRKGKFGEEDFVSGDISDVIRVVRSETISPKVEAIIGSKESAAEDDKINLKERSLGEIQETEGMEQNLFNSIAKEVEAENKRPATTPTEKEKTTLEIARKSKTDKNNKFLVVVDNSGKELKQHQEGADQKTIEAWKNTQADFSIREEYAKTLTNQEILDNFSYYNGKIFLDYNYVSGNIYQKLDDLEEEKSKISQEQYDKQKRILQAVLPPKSKIEDIRPDVRAPIIKSIKIGNESLFDGFVSFVNSLNYNDFGSLTKYDIRSYIFGESVRGGDKERNKYVRENRGRVANYLFSRYLNEGLSENDRNYVIDKFDQAFNGFYFPDYKDVPLLTKTVKNFKGGELVLNDAQRRAIGFLVSKGTGIAALDVGVGKTISALIAINETMERGWAKKPLIVVEKNTLAQWIKTISEIYPSAKINNWNNLGKEYDEAIKNGELVAEDGSITIVTYNGLKRIRFSDETYYRLSGKMADDIDNPSGGTKRSKELVKSKAEETVGMVLKETKDIYFEDIGFDHITIDEAQNANHIIKSSRKGGQDIYGEKSKESDEFGLQMTPSVLGLQSWYASQYIQEKNNGRNVILLSATPFTNNPLEYYSILSLVAYKSLNSRGINNVNDFLSTFMELDEAPAWDMAGNPKITRQIKSFKNYRELVSLLTENILFIDGEEAGVVRPQKKTKQFLVKRNSRQIEIMTELNKKITELSGKIEASGERLSMFNKVIQATLTPYVDGFYSGKPSYKEFVDNSPKIKAMVTAIAQTKKDNPAGGHIIYSKLLKSGNINYHSLIKEYLVKEVGYKDSEVGLINGAVKDEDRVKIQDAFNEGKVKIVIGTDSILRGVNLQENTTDIHMLTLLWNYEDLRQLSGRAWRQGNNYRTVRINQYLMENSGDIFVSQKLSIKEKRSENLTSFKRPITGNTADAGLISFEEAINTIITDPVAKVKMEEEMDRSRIDRAINQATANAGFLRKKFGAEDISKLENEISNNEYQLNVWSGFPEKVKEIKEDISKARAKIKKIREGVEKLGIDISQLEKAEKELSLLKTEKDGLKEKYSSLLKEAEILSAQSKEADVKTNYEAIKSQLANDNKEEIQYGTWSSKYQAPKSARSGASVGIFADGTPIKIGSVDKIMPIQTPELLLLANELGAQVSINPRLKTARGVFTGGDIQLKPDIFTDPAQAAKTLAHEIGHLVDWLPDKTMSKGNILGRLYSLSGYLKNTFGETKVNNKEIRDELVKLSNYWRPIGANPTSGFLKYRNSSAELYADAISVLLNSPGTLEEMAPNFYREFFNGMDNKPEVKEAYFGLQEILSGGSAAVVASRRSRVRKSAEKANYKAIELEKIRQEEKKLSAKDWFFGVKKAIFSNNAWFEERAKGKYSVLTGNENPVNWLNERNYTGTKVKAMLENRFLPIISELKNNGLTDLDLHEILLYERILYGDRGQIANPFGLSPDTVEDILGASLDDSGAITLASDNKETLAGRLGIEKYTKLKSIADRARKELRELYREGKEAGIYSDEVMEMVEGNDYYVPFKSQKYQYKKTTAGVKRQIGTLGEIENTFHTMLEKATVIKTAIEYNKTKARIISYLEKEYPEELEPARERFINTHKEIVRITPQESKMNPDYKGKGTITYFVDGKIVGYNVSSDIADSINNSTSEGNIIFDSLSLINNKVFKPLFTSWNLGFALLSNPIRDFNRYYRNMSDATVISTLKDYIKAAPDAVKSVFTNDSEIVKEMKELGVLIDNLGIYGQAGISEGDSQVEVFLTKHGLKESKKNKILALLDFISSTGQALERLPKVAAYMNMKEKNGGEDIDAAQRDFIRRYVGSPDFLSKGTWTKQAGTIFLFANPMIQATRADFEIATSPETRAGFWWKTGKSVILPKMLMLAAMLGLFGDWIKEIFAGASEYDKTNYTIIPLGEDEYGKSIYLRIPPDESSRLIGGIFWKLITIGQDNKDIIKSITDIASLAGGQLPGLSPALTIPTDILSFAQGNNIWDSYRQRTVFSQQQMEAGYKYKAPAFIKYLFNESGGSVFIKLDYSQGEPKSNAEKVLALPLISNTIGRMLKVTDYGKTEKERVTEAKEAKTAAIRNIEENKVITRYIDQYKSGGDKGIFRARELERQMIQEIVGTSIDNKDEAERITILRRKFRSKIKIKE